MAKFPRENMDLLHSSLFGCTGAECLLAGYSHLVVGWRVGVWLPSPEKFAGLRKLRPHVELQSPQGTSREVWQRSRNETSTGLGDDAFVTLSAPECEPVKRPSCKWKGQTVADEDST